MIWVSLQCGFLRWPFSITFLLLSYVFHCHAGLIYLRSSLCHATHSAASHVVKEWVQQFNKIITAPAVLFYFCFLVSHQSSMSEHTITEALVLTAACSLWWGSDQCDGCWGLVLTTKVEQGQRFRQREGLKERSAVVDTVKCSIYRAQWTEGEVGALTAFAQLQRGTFSF